MTRPALLLLIGLAAGCSPHSNKCEKLQVQLEDTIRSFDADHDRRLGRVEWDKLHEAYVSVAKAKAEQNHATLVVESSDTFDRYDKDGDGFVELNELSGGICDFK